MAHKRKDTFVPVLDGHRGKHLTAETKRRQSKAERRAAEKEFARQFEEWNGNSDGSVGVD
jgi:hypothetical protein